MELSSLSHKWHFGALSSKPSRVRGYKCGLRLTQPSELWAFWGPAKGHCLKAATTHMRQWRGWQPWGEGFYKDSHWAQALSSYSGSLKGCTPWFPSFWLPGFTISFTLAGLSTLWILHVVPFSWQWTTQHSLQKLKVQTSDGSVSNGRPGVVNMWQARAGCNLFGSITQAWGRGQGGGRNELWPQLGIGQELTSCGTGRHWNN